MKTKRIRGKGSIEGRPHAMAEEIRTENWGEEDRKTEECGTEDRGTEEID